MLRYSMLMIIVVVSFLFCVACEETDDPGPINQMADHTVFYTFQTAVALPSYANEIQSYITGFFKPRKKFLTGELVSEELVYGNQSLDCSMLDPSASSPIFSNTEERWLDLLASLDNQSPLVDQPDCNYKHVFVCGSLMDNWDASGLKSAAYLEMGKNKTKGKLLVYWDDAAFALARAGKCNIALNTINSYIAHELIHQYIESVHCATRDCVMCVQVSGNGNDFTYIPQSYSSLRLCGAHDTELKTYPRRSKSNPDCQN
jgi:hypothetical protein